MLLPAWLLARRCDGTAVIGNMLTRAPRALGVPEDGGRDGGAGGYGAGPAAPVPLVGGRVREFFTRLAGVLSPDPVPLNRAGSPVGGRGRGGRGCGGRGPRWSIWIEVAYRDQEQPEIAYLGQQPVQGGLISDRACDDGFFPVAADLEVLEPGGPPPVEDALDPDLVVRVQAMYRPSV